MQLLCYIIHIGCSVAETVPKTPPYCWLWLESESPFFDDLRYLQNCQVTPEPNIMFSLIFHRFLTV